MSKLQIISIVVAVIVFLVLCIYVTMRQGVNEGVAARMPSLEHNKEANSSSTTFTDRSGLFSFLYPSDWKPVASTTMTIQDGGEYMSISLPDSSSLLTPWLSVAKVSFPTQSSPLTSYESCCSGKRYWYDAAGSQWVARDFSMPEDVPEGKEPAEKSVPFSLLENGICSLSHKEGGVPFIQIYAGDEGVQTVWYYYLLGDNGSLVQFTSYYDIYDKTALSRPVHWILKDIIIPSFAFTHEKIVEMKCK
jgi:hypothetical protein